jgi:hypothetical protein
MSLIALMATSVSAYAVSRRNLAPGGVGPRLGEQLDTGHLGHPLVGRDQRHRLGAQRQPGQHGQRLGSRRRPDDAVVGAVPADQVAGAGRGHLGVVVDRQDGRFAHGMTLERDRQRKHSRPVR